jgi:hypothetical protein
MNACKNLHSLSVNRINRRRVYHCKRENDLRIKLFIFSKVIPSFRPRFTGKCDRQSRDLTQLTSGYNFAIKPTTNHLRSSSCSNSHLRMHSLEYSMENMNIFLSSTRNRSLTHLHPSRTRSPLSYASWANAFLYLNIQFIRSTACLFFLIFFQTLRFRIYYPDKLEVVIFSSFFFTRCITINEISYKSCFSFKTHFLFR